MISPLFCASISFLIDYIAGSPNMTSIFQFLAQFIGIADIPVLPAKKLIGVFAVNLPYVSTGYFDIVVSWFHWTLPGFVVG